MGWIWIEAAGGSSAADSTFSVAYDDDHLFRLFRWRHPSFTHSALFGEKGRAVRELGDIHIYIYIQCFGTIYPVQLPTA